MKVEDLAAIRQGAKMQEMLPYVQDVVSKQERAIDNRVLMRYEAGELTPQAALEAWVEKIALRKVLRAFDFTIKMGQGAGVQAQSALDLP